MAEGAWLIGFLVVQRLAELVLAEMHTRRLRAQGAVEFGKAHYPALVVLHAAWIIALWVLGRGHDVDRWWLAVFVLLQAGRVWVIASLGHRWTTRIIVLPGVAAMTKGPYRWLRHPNYVVVALEIAVVPLTLGLPLVAVVFSVANAAVLAWRINVENQALAWAAGQAVPPPAVATGTLANEYPRR